MFENKKVQENQGDEEVKEEIFVDGMQVYIVDDNSEEGDSNE